ncbi:serine hydrolase [Virgibacillus sediminis]|uniref:Serine hydrolase n=1 Tax=Virgibacillus sediminis TaxID=202260 RepID=A0ABV7A7K2_9BACI
MEQLSDSIQSIISRSGGTWAAVLEDLDTGEHWKWKELKAFYAASIIKVPIMIAVFRELEKGSIMACERKKLRQEDQVGGCGVLQHLTPGTSLTIYDLVTLMMIQSDNMAANMLIDLVGAEQIQQTMKEIGMNDSMFCHKLMTAPGERNGENTITAGEMHTVLKNMVSGHIISRRACREMIGIMKKQQLRHYLAGKLPVDDLADGRRMDWEMADKTGEVKGVRHNTGIIYVGKRTMLVTVLSKGAEASRSLKGMQEIGWEIYKYMDKQR